MQQIKYFLKIYFGYVFFFILMKIAFMIVLLQYFTGCGVADVCSVVWHGLPLDLTMAGYLSIMPGMLKVAALWTRRRWPLIALHVYTFVVLWALLFIFVLNVALYPYWRFPLDATPLFYFFSSPELSIASASWLHLLLLLVLVVLWGVTLVWLIRKEQHARQQPTVCAPSHPVKSTFVLVVLLALLFIPIRGGFTVSTMNTGKVYFSARQELNHAAVNPAFSLLESLTHQEDFGSQYRYMDDRQAKQIFKGLTDTRSDSTQQILSERRPDVYLVIMESFSQLVMNSGATPHLTQIASEGIFFKHFYANSFRTDRGLVAILAGYPVPPSVSLMKYPAKTRNLPSIARAMAKAGYGTAYYYGGDADFCNQRSFLVSQGYRHIVEDKDFPLKQRLSKWGVPDGPLFERVQEDVATSHSRQPMFRVVQTSSSHEPFDVPEQTLSDKRLNAFAYADHCIGRFVGWLKQSGRWEHSLIVLVADHQGAWPESVEALSLERFHIPLVLAGGAVKAPMKVDVFGSQHDIAATLLGQLGISHKDFLFSKDLFDVTAPHFAFFTIPDAFGMVSGENQLVYDNKSGHSVVNKGKANVNLLLGKAYLQCLMDDIEEK